VLSQRKAIEYLLEEVAALHRAVATLTGRAVRPGDVALPDVDKRIRQSIENRIQAGCSLDPVQIARRLRVPVPMVEAALRHVSDQPQAGAS
jgi:hypothetical protein